VIWSFVLTGVGVLGLYIAGSKSLWGWAIGLAAQPLWAIFAIVTGQYGFVISAAIYGWVYGRNLLRWWKEDREQRRLAAEGSH
jgi:hypothetical protein